MTDIENPQIEMEIAETETPPDEPENEVGSIQSGKPKKVRSAKQKAVFERARQVREDNIVKRKMEKENLKIRKKEAKKKAVEEVEEEVKRKKQPKRKVKKQVVYEESSSSEEEEPEVVVVRRRKKTKPKRKPKVVYQDESSEEDSGEELQITRNIQKPKKQVQEYEEEPTYEEDLGRPIMMTDFYQFR